jgi:uncharacterized protein
MERSGIIRGRTKSRPAIAGQMSRKWIGTISDTHGILRPEAVKVLTGAQLILHAGDIGKPEILTELEKLGLVAAIRGNNDKGEWAAQLPETKVVNLDGISIYMIHDLKTLSIDPAAEGHKVVVSGHSHKPQIRESGGVLYLNPGSAGPRRFKLPITVAKLTVDNHKPSAEIIELPIG